MSGTPNLSANLPLTDELAAVFARMSGLLLSEETVDTALGLLSALAQETVPGASGAGVSMVDEERRRSSGSTDARVREADALQYELDEARASPRWPPANWSGSTTSASTGGGPGGRRPRCPWACGRS